MIAATALFEIAKESGQLDQVAADLATFQAALDDSADLREMIHSPVFTREDQGNAIRVLAGKMGLGASVTNTLLLMA